MDSQCKQEKIHIEIYAKATTSVDLVGGESISDLESRHVDVYYHGAGSQGYMDKEDLGSDMTVVRANSKDELILVDKGFFLALIDTADRLTELESVYDDARRTSYAWNDINGYVFGEELKELQEHANREKL
jgi:hypothetical protein